MRLSELTAGVGGVDVSGDPDVEISGLSYDSRKVNCGDLFFATARDEAQRRRHLQQALDRGARALAVGRWNSGDERPAVTIIECERLRGLMGKAAARFFNAPSRRVDLIGVTGTSGKTTTTYLLSSIFEAAGVPCGIIGTIGILAAGRRLYSGLTTPESIDFEAALASMEAAGVRCVAAEISSIGLAEGRVDELSFRACLFTNLGRDHLDYHSTIEGYFAAKLRLFSELLPRSAHSEAVAVVRGDDPYGARVLRVIRGRKLSFGLDASMDVHPEMFETGLDGIRATIMAAGRRFEVSSPLLGEINLLNILGASAVSVALGIGTDAVVEGLRRCPGAPGRLEIVPGLPGVKILVDYAHKPDALEAVLRNLRALGPRKLICVFGCGGDRDRGKRPIMGEIAGRLADVPILTSDNPRSEDPLAIIADAEAGLIAAGLHRIEQCTAGNAAGYLIEPDRRGAIALAVKIARPGDIAIIAGKGHEDYQLIGSQRLNFDDRVVVRELLSPMGAD
jgi:UDP-N-acetylmuramoyl-L-alanyl-D-glutamate--2,6-diaminopimelate ligase